MTDKLILTTAQRDNYLQIMRNNMQDPDAYDAITELQSLPVVERELWTDEKAPQPITADDVTDEMVDAYLDFVAKISYLRHPDVPYHGTTKGDSAEKWERRVAKAALVASIIKHRSEAR